MDDDLTRWHGTIMFPSDHLHYPALPLHFTMTFTTSYPSVGPELKLMNTIAHSHIYGDSICFSLLPDFRAFFEGESAPSTCCESHGCHHAPVVSIDSVNAQAVPRLDSDEVELWYQITTVPRNSWLAASVLCPRRASGSFLPILKPCPPPPPFPPPILQPSPSWGSPSTTDWNPTRSVRSFLEDLAAFVITDEDQERQISQHDRDAARAAAAKLECSCGHGGVTALNNVPPSSITATAKAKPTAAAQEDPETYLRRLAVDRLLGQCRALLVEKRPEDPASFLGEHLTSIGAWPAATAVATEDEIPAAASEGLQCSITGKRWDEEGVLMGFGVDVDRGRGRNGKWKITTDLTPICREAFEEDGIRTSALGATITGWLPFVINHRNWTKRGGREAAYTAISDVHCQIFVHRGTSPSSSSPRRDRQAITREKIQVVLTELWKTKVVEVMSDQEHASEKVLHGLCAIDHLLLALASADKGLARAFTEQVRTFVTAPSSRSKTHLPDFGRFYPLLLLSDIGWLPAQPGEPGELGVARHAVAESMARNALWIQRADPGLADPGPIADRVDRSWPSSQTGLKLAAFQVRYLLARPEWVAGAVASPLLPDATAAGRTCAMFNELGGRPTEPMIAAFQATVKRVQKIANFGELFSAVGCPGIAKTTVDAMLMDGMIRSKQLGYHGQDRHRRGDSRGGRGGRGGGGRGGGRGGRSSGHRHF